jgi:uroporphyrin-III C-methyltransferase
VTSHGKVFLIGAGPGDLELLTLKAVRVIGDSDVILLDSLANPQVLKYAKPGAKVIEVGKRGGRESTAQTQIEEQMIRFANQGLTVSRIKGGDPLVFARGGEEIAALQKMNIEFEIIPGITAASGICASLGISLTHRELSHAVLFLTGPQFEPPSDLLVLPPMDTFAGTLVIYMGLKSASHVCHQLIARGMPPTTPSVAVQSGTLPHERRVFATLDTLPRSIQEAQLDSPVLLIIGPVVALSSAYSNVKTVALSGRGQ